MVWKKGDAMKKLIFPLIFAIMLTYVVSAAYLRIELNSDNFALEKYFVIDDLEPYIFSSGGNIQLEDVILNTFYKRLLCSYFLPYDRE